MSIPGRDDRRDKPTTDCPVCSKIRPLAEHLNEIAEFCFYLGNSAQYSDSESSRTVRTEVIGDWLRLAARLERVEINAWAFEDDESALYCGTAADRVDSDSKHFTAYSTALTRFIFVTNALEETYRFVSHNHDSLCPTPPGRRLRAPAIKAAALLDAGLVKTALHHRHIVSNLSILFDRYVEEHRERGEASASLPDTTSRGLHILRILRNHIAHGVFPLIPNPEYEGNSDRALLLHLLNHLCRVGALSIQAFMATFNDGFKSYEYGAIEGAHGPEFERFLKNCTPEYALSLHISGPFRLSSWIREDLPDQVV